jgi:hypothetical protein
MLRIWLVEVFDGKQYYLQEDSRFMNTVIGAFTMVELVDMCELRCLSEGAGLLTINYGARDYYVCSQLQNPEG